MCFFPTANCILEHEPCSDNEFQCNNGRCLDIRRKCNGYDECGDRSDEVDCGKLKRVHMRRVDIQKTQ